MALTRGDPGHPAGRGHWRHASSNPSRSPVNAPPRARRCPSTAVPGEDVVVLHIDGGPSLVLHPENARDLLRSQDAGLDATRGAAAGADVVAVPVRLQWRGLEDAAAGAGATRGFLGNVVLKALEVVTGLAAVDVRPTLRLRAWSADSTAR